MKAGTSKFVSRLFLVTAIGVSPQLSHAADPSLSIEGPVPAQPPGHESGNSIFNSSHIDLEPYDYIENEYFISGEANRYSTNPDFVNGEVVESNIPFKSRIIVRRPEAASDFNGTVVVEWFNVTIGNDNDIDWWLTGHDLMDRGYVYIGVSAQQVGVNALKARNPSRYGSLDVTNAGTAPRDDLSYDVFAAVGRAVVKAGESQPSGQVDILDGLRPEHLIAIGDSQSAMRLQVYINNIHPLDPVYEAFMLHGGGDRVRDDGSVKIMKVLAETDIEGQGLAYEYQPDTTNYRQWEVAGSSHVGRIMERNFVYSVAYNNSIPESQVPPLANGCELPPFSEVPMAHVLSASIVHLSRWVSEGTPPPIAPRLQTAQYLPEFQYQEDEYGNVLGGIRLATHAVPTAHNGGYNAGPLLCRLFGSHTPFDDEVLAMLYPTHADYLGKVRAVVEQNLADGFILPSAAEQTIAEAEQSAIGR